MEWTRSKNGLEWIMEEQLRKIFDSKPEGTRRRGRPRLRWLEDAQKDLPEMNVKRWRKKAVDREGWAFVIKGAQAHRESYSKGVFLIFIFLDSNLVDKRCCPV